MFNPLDLPSQVPFHFPSDDEKDPDYEYSQERWMGLFWKEVKSCQDNVDIVVFFWYYVIENLSIYHLLKTNHIRNIATDCVEIYRILSILQ